MILINIIGMAALGHMGADFFEQFDKLPSKPLKCNMCLTFWLSIVPFVMEYGFVGLTMAATASLLSELMYKLLSRI